MNVKLAIRFFTGILIVTGILLVVIGIHNYHAQQAVNGLKERYLQIEEFRSQIIHYDEIMTMSARMAAATGDIRWEARYREYEPKLSAAIQQAMVVSPEIYRKETDRDSIGKAQLLFMEDQSFSLIRAGKSAEAMSILFGSQYETQRTNYERAIEQLNVFLKKQMDAALSVENSKAYFAQVSFITVFILLLLSWLVLLCIARGAQEALVEGNHRLDELNKTLDQKVQERTSRLAETLQELQKTHRDLQNAQSQLLQSEKYSAIGQLAAGIAHEINNPIGFINCNLQTLEKYLVHYRQLLGFLNKLEKALNDKDKERVAQIIISWEKVREETNFNFIEGDIGNLIKESMEGCESMKKIVADLGAFANPDKGKEDAVDLHALIESMLNIAWNEIKYKAQIRKDYADLPPIVCNPQKIGQVFVNLLTNAAHAIEGKGFITVKTYTRDQYVCVDITDTGCGIPAESITRIFDPFFTTRPVGKGVGLGLSVSYDIVRRHGGEITFISEESKGTTFTVMLPVEYAHVAKQIFGGGDMKEISVLFLDDEQKVLNSITRMFSDEPYGVAVAANANEALGIMAREKIKVVLSDLRMPDISGVEFLRRIKLQYPNTVRILFTAYADLPAAEKAINVSEVYRFINKPWHAQELKSAVVGALYHYDLVMENRKLFQEAGTQNKELQEANAKLKVLYGIQQEFSSTLSHELRTPLASIKAAIDIVMSQSAGAVTDAQKDFLGRAKSNVDRLNRLINNILDLAHLESGKTTLKIDSGDINQVIKSVVETQEAVARNKGLYLKISPDAQVPVLAFDQDKIIQVVNNLISNAIKFTSAGGITITSVMRTDTHEVEVRVEDTGHGIKKEDMTKLFEKFQQLGEAHQRCAGTGLGLAICKEIVRQHGGRINVESNVGKGSSFIFNLPVHEGGKQ